MSYVLAAEFASITVTAILLEHTLRLAVIDTKAGYQGAMDKKLWDTYSSCSIRDFFNREPDLIKRIIADEDTGWWIDFAGKVVRNKALHFDVPAFIEKIASREDYMGMFAIDPDRQKALTTRFWWGLVFHRADALVAIAFLRESTEMLRRLIQKVAWKPDRSRWASQEWEYNSFFEYPWTLDALRKSLEKVPPNMSFAPSSDPNTPQH